MGGFSRLGEKFWARIAAGKRHPTASKSVKNHVRCNIYVNIRALRWYGKVKA